MTNWRNENRRRTRSDPEYELQDTGVFNESRYFDIVAEYAKQDVDDLLIRITIANRGPEAAPITFLPILWFRNTWCWGANSDVPQKPQIRMRNPGEIEAEHPKLGEFLLSLEGAPELLFTENETNTERLWKWRGENTFYKDAFHEYLIGGRKEAVNSHQQGTKACAVYSMTLGGGEQKTLQFRLCRAGSADLPREQWDAVFDCRIQEANEFYAHLSQGLERAGN